MAAETASVFDYTDGFPFGSAASAGEYAYDPFVRSAAIPIPREQSIPRAKGEKTVNKAHGGSKVTVVGAIIAAALMVFVVLAQVNYNEVTHEIVELNEKYDTLTERETKLEIEHERIIDMKEIERYARDVLGMSQPDANQVSYIANVHIDKAEIIDNGNEGNALRGFGTFISSLFDYFRKG